MSDSKPQRKEGVAVLVLALTIVSALAAGVLACASYITEKPRAEALLKETNAALLKLQPGFDNVPDQGKVFVVDADASADLSKARWELLPAPPAEQGKVNQVVFYPAMKDGKLLSVIAQAISPIGYGGNMTVMAALSPVDGAVRNVIVTTNNETPGLGDAVFNRSNELTLWGLLKGTGKADPDKLPPNRTLDFFRGKSYVPDQGAGASPDAIPASKWAVRKDGGDFLFVTGATVSSRAVTYGVKKIEACYCAVKPQLAAVFAATK